MSQLFTLALMPFSVLSDVSFLWYGLFAAVFGLAIVSRLLRSVYHA